MVKGQKIGAINMKFLVTRMDALHDGTNKRKINESNMWPILVEASNHASAVEAAYSQNYGPNEHLPLNREFLVVHLIDAEVVTLKHKTEYIVQSRPFPFNSPSTYTIN